MARLSYKQRLKRLERRSNRVKKMQCIIGITDQETGAIQAMKVDSVKTDLIRLPNRAEFDLFVDLFKDDQGKVECDVILDNEILFLGSETINTIINDADADTLQKIADGDLTEDEQKELCTIFHSIILSQVHSTPKGMKP